MDGGGEKKGIVGMVVGMVGREGIVVGIVGSEAAGNGGNVNLGTVGMVGSVGFGRVGNWVAGKGGSVDAGSVGMAGSGGNVAAGKDGIVGSEGACKRLRAARVTWMLESDNAMMKESSKL